MAAVVISRDKLLVTSLLCWFGWNKLADDLITSCYFYEPFYDTEYCLGLYFTKDIYYTGHVYQSHRLTLHLHTRAHTHTFGVDIKQRDADKGKGTCSGAHKGIKL